VFIPFNLISGLLGVWLRELQVFLVGLWLFVLSAGNNGDMLISIPNAITMLNMVLTERMQN